MTSGTDQGRTIERAETFVVSHTLNPRTGPSIALSDAHAYVLVKLTDGAENMEREPDALYRWNGNV